MAGRTRKIIKINEEKCDGCGLCIPSCAEGALQVIDGKARLVDDRFCDGLGNCLGECPRGAIEIIERPAEPFDQVAVEAHRREQKAAEEIRGCAACAGSAARELRGGAAPDSSGENPEMEPELSHWPIQLHLVSPRARFLQGRELLIAADCVPFALADFHRKLLKGKSLLICCPKLDDRDAYLAKLTAIFAQNRIEHITVAHMEVGCCFGLNDLVCTALERAGKSVTLEEVTIGVDGTLQHGGNRNAGG